jgi:succinate dehydrogenase / fumarate reductase membrane anchor subunit
MKKIEIAPSTKTGFHHWLSQRVSAIALIPLIIWLVLSLVEIALDPKGYLPVFFAYPFNAFMAILLFSTSFYHGSLGMRVIIEDYVTNKAKVHFYIMLVNFVSITTATAVIIAILKLHLIN